MPLQITRIAVLIAATAFTAASASSAEIKVLSANGMREVMQDLGPKFESATGHKLAIAFATIGVIVKRVQDGEVTDVIIVPKQGIDGLVKDGRCRFPGSSSLARCQETCSLPSSLRRPS